jgi:protein-S-isoprenylcysteine O-methyltransferase Ste14
MESRCTNVLRRGSCKWRLPRWLAGLYVGTMGPLVHGGIPYLLACYSIRWGWVDEHLSVWNALGLIFVSAGATVLIWCVQMHFVATKGPFKFVLTQEYLLTNGPYGFSRNPIYLSAATIWLGWAIFYGSVTVFVGLCILALTVCPIIVRREEYGIEARFGASYLAYKRRVPRWMGACRD